MKKSKKLLFSISAIMLLMAVLVFGSMTVCAEFEECDTNTAVVQTTAYDSNYDDDYYDNNTREYRRGTDWFRTIGTSLLVSVIGSAVAVGIVLSRYKFNGRTEPYPYNKKAALELSASASQDVLIHTDIKRERIERNRR